MAMCPKCDGFTGRLTFASPDEYRNFVRQLIEAVNQGRFSLIRADFPLQEMLTPPWPGDSNSRSRAPEARAFNQAGPLPEMVARHGIEPCPLAFQTSTLPSSSRAKAGGRCETRTRIARVQAVGNPLIRTAHLGRDERIELS